MSACAKKKGTPFCVKKIVCGQDRANARHFTVSELLAAKRSLAADEVQYSQYERCDIELQNAIYERLKR